MQSRPRSARRGAHATIRGSCACAEPIEATLVVLAATALTIAATYPVAFRLDQLGRINTDDGRWSIWVVSWVAHSADHASRSRSITRTSSTRTATRWRFRRPTLAPVCWARRCGCDREPVRHAQRRLPRIVRHRVRRRLLSRAISDRAAAQRRRWPASCSRFALTSSRAPRTCSCSSSARCRSACSRFTGWWTRRRSCARPRSACCLWATALTCAYYGIFAALMVGLGTLVYAVSRGLWRSARLLDRHRPRGVHQHRADAFLSSFRTRTSRTRWVSCARWTMREHYSANLGAWARLVGLGAPLVAARARQLQRSAVPGHPRRRSLGLAGRRCSSLRGLGRRRRTRQARGCPPATRAVSLRSDRASSPSGRHSDRMPVSTASSTRRSRSSRSCGRRGAWA